MGSYEIVRNEDRLVFCPVEDNARIVTGLLVFFGAIACNIVIGVLALVFQATAPPAISMGDRALFRPDGNHLGFLWLISTVLMILATPVYFAWVLRARTQFVFDRTRNRFVANRKLICRLSSIESICIEHVEDPDSRGMYRPTVVYADGFQLALDESYKEELAEKVAVEIGEFVGRPVIWRYKSPLNSPAEVR